MRLFIHADDYGLTRGMTDTILDAVDNGLVTSLSIVPNGHAFDYAIDEYKKRTGLRLAVHLNLFEGTPVSQEAELDLITDKSGRFSCSFPRLWLKYIMSFPAKRRRLKDQLMCELKSQIQKVKFAVGANLSIQVDSHVHFHMIPPVMESLLELSYELNIEYIRLPHEPFYLETKGNNSTGSFLVTNIIKNILLSNLSRKYYLKLKKLNIRTNDYFIGVLYTGRMTFPVVKKALIKIAQKNKNKVIEVLFHPGKALHNEKKYFQYRKGLLSYYYSPLRDLERNELKSKVFKDFLEENIF